MKLKIMCTGEIEVDFHDLKDLQITESGENLKATSQEKIDKLAASLRQYGVVNNIQVWKDSDSIYCFDAHHRKKALTQLEKEGIEIPLIPATRCLAKSKKEAKKLLILKESSNSWIDTEVINVFLEEIDFAIEEAKLVVEFQNFDWPEIDNYFSEFTEKYTKAPDYGTEQRSDSDDEKIKILIWIPERIKKETQENLNRRGIKYEIIQ